MAMYENISPIYVLKCILIPKIVFLGQKIVRYVSNMFNLIYNLVTIIHFNFSLHWIEFIFVCADSDWTIRLSLYAQAASDWLIFTIVWALPMTAGSSYTETRLTFMSHFGIN